MQTDLHRVIYSRQGLSDQHLQFFLYQILKGLYYIHSANVIHRDLKPGNLLCNKDCLLKICDLGLSRGFDQQDQQKNTQYVVTRWYRAPEVILQAGEYSKAVDIWSVGCIYAQLLGRNPIFPGKDYLQQVQRIISILGTPSNEDLSFISNQNALKYIRKTRQNWESLFPEANVVGLDLLSKMLTFNPNKRVSVEECLKHPYFECYQQQHLKRSLQAFPWKSDYFEPTKPLLQQLIYEEAMDLQKKSKY